MAENFDLVVIGTGSAASTVASRCRKAGWQVAIVDSRPFGGTCVLRGCDPKKVLVGAAEAVDWSHRLEGRGTRNRVRIEWTDLARFKRTFTDPIPAKREESFAKAGIVARHGRARFVGPTAVQVGDAVLAARHVVIAAGARPADLGIPGAEHAITSEQFLDLAALPGRIVFMGGGYVSFEFAHVAARAGAQVTILHRGPRPLVGFDADLVERLVRCSLEIGIDIRVATEVRGIEKGSKGFTVLASGATPRFQADLVVHGAGRVPDIDDLGLEAADVERERRGVKVNEFLQSISNPAVYAAGDAAQTAGLPLTPVAGYEGRIVAANLLEGNRHRPDYSGVPSVVFTIPPLAAVGLKEEEARKAGLNVRVTHLDTSGWYSSRRIGETCSGFKVLVEDGTGRILGAHLLGPSADELVNVFALAIRKGLTAEDLKEMLFAYPTHASDVQYML